ncbi:hypothetical protein N0V93_009540 [Gnomoniopsis smithogilvyi]|uniref:RRM domain-containing protein n=1 Tax=Gnomoniopsis smithogilvyi TaxID=1191159 RepID=A0A9W8YK38_9PEZI|nr:hypothetical protein N0V93_009540 [Gnomoniopsis smithogilvyi]
MASIKSYNTSPDRERFQRTKRVPDTGSERAASPSDGSSVGDDMPGGVRLDLMSIADSPENRYTPPHARHGFGASRFAQAMRRNATESPTRLFVSIDRDDVFTSPAKPVVKHATERSVTAADMQRLDDVVAQVDDNTLILRQQTSNLSMRHQINGVDAQNLYPPTACVFVANLPEPKDDVALEAAIYREFLKYGKCWVKIRRDSHHMPFAFVQFTSDAEAQDALEKGRGALIFGRPCRTEMVKANRTFIIQKKSGTPITIEEAERVLLAFGKLSKCELLHPQLRDTLGYSPTILVEFSMFDATRDLHTAFRNDPVYSVTAFDLKKNCAAIRSSSDEAFLVNCERDRRSIFVGDLPPTTEQDDLEGLFGAAGEILKINIIQRPANMNAANGFASAVRTMAFIEYAQPDMPEVAIAKLNGQTYKGATLRVERKSVKDRGPTPRHSHSRSSLILAHKPSNESVCTPGPVAPGSATRERFFPQQERAYQQQAQPVSPGIMATPNRVTPRGRAFSQQPGVDLVSPNPNMAPPMYGSYMGGYSGMSPYHNVPATGGNYTFGPGGAGPMTPASPGMPSPWSYYASYWPNMMGGYDPSMYMSPYAFQSPGGLQSPTPMMGGGGVAPGGFTRGSVAAAAAPAATGGEGDGHESTPTRVKSEGYAQVENSEKGDKA